MRYIGLDHGQVVKLASDQTGGGELLGHSHQLRGVRFVLGTARDEHKGVVDRSGHFIATSMLRENGDAPVQLRHLRADDDDDDAPRNSQPKNHPTIK